MIGMDNERRRLEISRTDNGWTLSGEIDASSAPLLTEAFSALPSSNGPIALVVEEVSFIDSSGLRVLIELAGRARDDERSVILERPSSSVVRLIEITGLSEMFGVQSPG